MIEGESEKEIKQGQSNHIDKETEIDLMDVLRKIIAIRKTIYKAAGTVSYTHLTLPTKLEV